MLGVLQAILTIAYPLLIVWALSRFEPRIVAGGVLGLLALRIGVVALRRSARTSSSDRRLSGSLALPLVLVAAVSLATAVWNDPLGLLLAPVFINGALLASFALSLRGRPIVETLARLQVDRLAPAEIRYCRKVTAVWCVFFFVNGAVSLALALSESLDAWALYTGFVSYVLMGLLFAGEYVVRHARFRRYEGAWSDPLLSRLFPARDLPEVVRTDGSGAESARTIELEVPTGLACWRGHFPGQPILPGVVQVDWVLREIEVWRGRRASLVAIEGLKFKRPVLPGESLVLELVAGPRFRGDTGRPGAPFGDASATSAASDTIEFCFRRGGEAISLGRVRFGASGAGGADAASGVAAPAIRPVAGASAGPEPSSVLVHRDPMIWLRQIEAHDAHETRCLVAVADCGTLRDGDGGVVAHVAIEWMAQAVAAHAGLERRSRGEAPVLGVLLGSRCVRFARPAYTAHERFRVVVVRGWGREQGAVSFDCHVAEIESGSRVAEARLSCFVPGEAGSQSTWDDGFQRAGSTGEIAT